MGGGGSLYGFTYSDCRLILQRQLLVIVRLAAQKAVISTRRIISPKKEEEGLCCGTNNSCVQRLLNLEQVFRLTRVHHYFINYFDGIETYTNTRTIFHMIAASELVCSCVSGKKRSAI